MASKTQPLRSLAVSDGSQRPTRQGLAVVHWLSSRVPPVHFSIRLHVCPDAHDPVLAQSTEVQQLVLGTQRWPHGFVRFGHGRWCL
jgi:hypothetical protein